jgi:AcrR family transcriptional regulator
MHMKRLNLTVEANGHALRSTDTQKRLIEAAIEIFGSVGYEGASTRALAQHAETSLAAIPYHFGGKRELYLAAAQTIASHVGALMDPVVAQLHEQSNTHVLQRIEEGLSGFTRVIVSGDEPPIWVSFFLRCEHDADEAFRAIYDAVIAPFERGIKSIIAQEIGCDPSSEELRIRVTLVISSILGFRTLRNMTFGSMGWDGLTSDRFKQLDHAIRLSARDLLQRPSALPRAAIRNRNSTPSQQSRHRPSAVGENKVATKRKPSLKEGRKLPTAFV